MTMDAKKASETLRKVADLVEKIPNDRLNGVACIVPPDGSTAIEVVLVGVQVSGFAEYLISQIKNNASPQNMAMPGMVGHR